MNALDSLRERAKAERSAAGLRDHVAELLSRGVSKDTVLDNLRTLMQEFREAGDEFLEDVIVDASEIVPDWSAPRRP